MDIAVILLYFAVMIGVGVYAKTRVHDQADYLVAGRRLGPFMYMGTLSALVLGGASTIGGVGLGYTHGISGMWLVVAIAIGLFLLSAFFAPLVQRLRVFTVSEALELRYGPQASLLSGVVMWLYTLMLTATSTIAYGTIFKVIFDMERTTAIIVGAAIVLAYSVLGGMWSITLTDIIQFCVISIGLFAVLLPVALVKAGGFSGIRDEMGATAFDVGAIGSSKIITLLVIYGFGLLIGQDIWQRVFTARSPQVARGSGIAASVYCVAYGVAGALIGAAARVVVPGLKDPDQAFVEITQNALPVGLTGLVLAAALAAVMSTASGGMMAAATVLRQDIVGRFTGHKERHAEGTDIRGDRVYLLAMGVLVVVVALLVDDVVAALTVAYDILVGGLLVPILLGLLWRRGTAFGALAGMLAGTATVIITMWRMGDLYANEPVYYGLAASLVAYLVVSLLTPRTSETILAEWDARLRRDSAEVTSQHR